MLGKFTAPPPPIPLHAYCLYPFLGEKMDFDVPVWIVYSRINFVKWLCCHLIIGNGSDPLHEKLIEFTQHIFIDIILLHYPTLMKHMMLIDLATRKFSAETLISICSQTRIRAFLSRIAASSRCCLSWREIIRIQSLCLRVRIYTHSTRSITHIHDRSPANVQYCRM